MTETKKTAKKGNGCLQCGRTLIKRKTAGVADFKRQKYCTRECSYEHRRTLLKSVKERQCTGCKRILSRDKFGTRSNGSTIARCKECLLVYSRQLYAKIGRRSPRVLIRKPQSEEKRRARRLVQSGVRAGRIIPLPCEVCGLKKTDGHHDDYLKPLVVRWLCRKHHMLVHRKKLSAEVAAFEASLSALKTKGQA